MRYPAVAITLLLVGCGDDGPSAPQPPQEFTLQVEGVVRAASSDSIPIQGATVGITTDRGAKHSDVTDQNGRFSMAIRLSPSADCTESGVGGNWAPCSIVVQAPGYWTFSESPWHLPCNTTVPGPWRVNFRLVREQILFASDRTGEFDLFVMNADGSDKVNLTRNPASDRKGSWSPDGMRIAFRSDRDGNQDVYVMSADGSNPVNLTNHPDGDFGPVWSPDGTRIAFYSYRQNGVSDIFVMEVDGSNPVNLTNHPDSDWFPAWSPDGQRIVFVSGRDLDSMGVYALFVMNVDGSNLTRVIDDCWIDSPAWSPDGSRIAFMHRCRGEHPKISAVDPDGSNRVELAGGLEDIHQPNWSPDGLRIAVSVDQAVGWDVYVMNVDGSDPVQLTDDPGVDLDPVWSPGP